MVFGDDNRNVLSNKLVDLSTLVAIRAWTVKGRNSDLEVNNQ